ncbi:MAG TPA: bifunctional hydroxymethylpyrimidine kinase/phosphomethylpyrimidine kinase [Abditibacteriaceae bacterium]|jgi:hydroxymethylpyrimidine/phosphomethylpyrimidine kinase
MIPDGSIAAEAQTNPTRDAVPCVLAIGGLDPSGGAGLPADARAVAAFGAHACCIATAVIAQNTQGVFRFEAVSPQMLAAQLDNLLQDIAPRAIKIGMLPDAATVEVVAERVLALPHVPLVLDTVFAPSSGPQFSNSETVQIIAQKLLPLCALVTPNIGEAQQLCNVAITNKADMIEAALCIQSRYGARRVLVKGGHLEGTDALDILLDGEDVIELSTPRLGGIEVRGTGCLLASATAAQLAHGIPIKDAVRDAKAWLTDKIANAQSLGQGRRVAV